MPDVIGNHYGDSKQKMDHFLYITFLLYSKCLIHPIIQELFSTTSFFPSNGHTHSYPNEHMGQQPWVQYLAHRYLGMQAVDWSSLQIVKQ